MRATIFAVLFSTGAALAWAGDEKSGDCSKTAKSEAAAPAEKSASKAADTKAEPLTAQSALEGLKALAGTWEGSVKAADGPKATVIYRVISNGSTVMETLFPDTPHEMITMFHLDGGDLVLTHYCAAGNQPRMKLDLKSSAPGDLRFAFAGGSNLSETGPHMHEGKIRLVDADHVEAEWTSYSGDKPQGTNAFSLVRKP